MSSDQKVCVTIGAKVAADFGMPIVIDKNDDTRRTIIFHVATPDNAIGILGTFDEICDFAAAILGKMFSWPLLMQREEWFGQEDLELVRKAQDDARSNDGQGDSSQDGDGPAGEREGFTCPGAA